MESVASSIDIRALNEKINQKSAFIDLLFMELNKSVVGQKHMVERLLIGLLANGHVLLEGVPGLAKTLAIKSLASAIQGKFARIQFTPDLLPADILGTMVYNHKSTNLLSEKAQFLPISYLQMKSIVHLQKFKVPCWKPCKNGL